MTEPKKKPITLTNPLANSSAFGAPTTVLAMNEEEKKPIKVSGPHLEDPLKKKIAELRAEAGESFEKMLPQVFTPPWPRSVQYSNHYILGWLIDRINNLEDAEGAREAMLVAAEKSAHEGLRRVAEELKAELTRREAL